MINAITHESTEYFAKIIFVNAAAINTNLILLNSTSSRFPNGIGNDSGVLGKYFAFHNYRGKVTAEYDGLLDYTTEGRRPTGSYIPRFRNLHKQEMDFLRGYAVALNGRRPDEPADGWGEELKENLAHPKEGTWRINAGMMGETIPKATNQLTLSKDKKDEWGVPLLEFSIDYDDNDEKMLLDFFDQVSEMFKKAGFTNIKPRDTKQAPGLDIHEMGGARMGKDPKTSMLNSFNQLHACKNVFVTDGACMTSTSTQNPSLTYMALTARAVSYAFDELKKGSL